MYTWPPPSLSQCLALSLLPFVSNASIALGVPGGSVVKNPPAKQETWVQSLGQEYSLEKEMATHCSILAWKIPWIEEPGRLQSMGSQRVVHYLGTNNTRNITLFLLKRNTRRNTLTLLNHKITMKPTGVVKYWTRSIRNPQKVLTHLPLKILFGVLLSLRKGSWEAQISILILQKCSNIQNLCSSLTHFKLMFLL